ncbi:MAG: hypothetical protein QXT25_02905 [Candidatus Anstonellaceae archaeon]
MSAEKNICIQTARQHYYAVMNRLIELKKEVNAFASKAPIVEGIRKTNGLEGNSIIYVLECERKALSLLRTIERKVKNEPYHLLEEFKKLDEEVKSITPQKLQQMNLAPESPAAMAFFIGFSDKQVNELNRILGEYIDFEVQMKVVELEQNSLDKAYQIQYTRDGESKVVGFMEAKRTFVREDLSGKLNIYNGAAQIKYSRSEEGFYVIIGMYNILLDKGKFGLPLHVSSNIDRFVRDEIGMNFEAFRMDLGGVEFSFEAMNLFSQKPNADKPDVVFTMSADVEKGAYKLRDGSILYAKAARNRMILVVDITNKFVDVIISADEKQNIHQINRFY